MIVPMPELTEFGWTVCFGMQMQGIDRIPSITRGLKILTNDYTIHFWPRANSKLRNRPFIYEGYS